MELKLATPSCRPAPCALLIVPYGIETKFCASRELSANLLIVPYGIETQAIAKNAETAALLIVPYGIETKTKKMFHVEQWTFNRTLWN